MTDTQGRSLREDIAEVLDNDNGYSHAVQTWAATARDLLENLDAAEARIQAVRDVLDQAEATINRHPAYTFSGQRMDPIINGADVRRALDGDA